MFEENNISITTSVEARKEKIESEAAWKILSAANEIIIGRGKNSHSFTPLPIARKKYSSNHWAGAARCVRQLWSLAIWL